MRVQDSPGRRARSIRWVYDSEATGAIRGWGPPERLVFVAGRLASGTTYQIRALPPPVDEGARRFVIGRWRCAPGPRPRPVPIFCVVSGSTLGGLTQGLTGMYIRGASRRGGTSRTTRFSGGAPTQAEHKKRGRAVPGAGCACSASTESGRDADLLPGAYSTIASWRWPRYSPGLVSAIR